MKKFFLILAISLLSLNMAFSQKISIDEGKTIVKNVIKERFDALGKDFRNYKISDSYVETFEGTEVFYVYNLQPEGFVIISAYKNIEPLLAFSYESQCSIERRHSSVEAVLKSYAEQIAYGIKNNVVASEETASSWRHFDVDENNFVARNVRSMDQLLRTKWNQGKYYNTMCPADNGGNDGHVVVGCVATAIGQIFNYFRYPTHGTGSYEYDHETYGHLAVNFAEQTYNYDNMPVSATVYNDELAKLLYNIGVSVDMHYGPDGSGMNNHKGAYTMSTYFGYSDQATYLFKDSLPDSIYGSELPDSTITDSVWNGILVNHLDRRIPLYYAGWGDYVYSSGHAFVFDGYSDSTRYHINWGWGGSYDGFFTISNLVPGGSNFRLAHEVIVNAVPQEQLSGCEGLKTSNIYEGMIEDGSGPLADYYPNSNCSWLINAQDSISGYTIKFEKFDIDESDYIIIYDGDSENAPILDIVYGNDTPENTYTSTSMSLLIKFVSDETATGDGWMISYTPIIPRYCQNMETLTELIDTISDGSNGYLYHNNTNCTWRLQLAETLNINIHFLEMDTEQDKDFVRILKDGQSMGKFSGNELPEDLNFDVRVLTIMFTSNASGCKQGFKLAYNVGTTSIEQDLNNGISIYPNPTNSILNISGNGIEEISICDILGREIMNEKVSDVNSSINISSLSEGNYLVRITEKSGNISTQKIIINR